MDLATPSSASQQALSARPAVTALLLVTALLPV